jgi:hypothetical protein
MTLQRVALALTLLIVALHPERGSAGMIPWSYQWNAHPTVIDANPLGPDQTSSGGITLTPGAITLTGANPGVALGNANIIAVNLTAFTFTPSTNGEPYSFTNSPYSLGITLTDVDSNQSGTLHFAGVFDGNLTDWTVDLQTRFTSATQQWLILGQNRYTVDLTTYVPPGPPAEGGEGNISAFVSVLPVSVPEPSALILAAIGLAGAAFFGLRQHPLP